MTRRKLAILILLSSAVVAVGGTLAGRLATGSNAKSTPPRLGQLAGPQFDPDSELLQKILAEKLLNSRICHLDSLWERSSSMPAYRPSLFCGRAEPRT